MHTPLKNTLNIPQKNKKYQNDPLPKLALS